MIGPAEAVTPVPASPPRVGLIASARTGTDLALPARWINGFAYEPENYCGANGVADPCSASLTVSESARDVVTVDPVILWAADNCSTYGVRDRRGRASRRLVACQSKLLAGELWEGTLAQASGFDNKYLASPDANTISLTSVSPSDALACMEQALADCSCTRSMIHVTPGLMVYLRREYLVERVGNVFTTANDTIVVADAGYTGTGPEGQPAVTGSVWMYGTDIVNVALDDIQTTPRADNDIAGMGQTDGLYDDSLTYRAQRLAAAWFDGCCHLAIPVDIDVCTDLAAS